MSASTHDTPAGPAFAPHEHADCRNSALAAVREACAARHLRLTPARKCVLDALLESHRAWTAYELLDRLRDAGLGHQPPVVYRALEFLVMHGFAHRIERISGYVACMQGGGPHAATFFVCRDCRGVAETRLPHLERWLEGAAAQQDFTLERGTVEAEGLCSACRAGEGA